MRWQDPGPVSCSDVIGYSDSSIMIHCYHQENGEHEYYFCKTTTKECIEVETSNTWIHKDRISLLHLPGVLAVMYRRLSFQDSGLYQCGQTGLWSRDLKLTVERDPCCSGSKTVTGYLGETVTISCSYPDQYEKDTKYFYQDVVTVISTKVTERDRFSISDNRGSRVLSVRISDVREDDGGVYYCGVWNGGGAVSYYSLYTEIQLQVTAPGSSIIIIITVCVSVVLLLIGGAALIFYRLRCRRTHVTGSTPSSRMETKDPGPTYTTVSFLKNPDSPTDAAVTVKYLIILCRPRWPREISGVIVTTVYIPLQADTDLALGILYKAVNRQEATHPEAAFIVDGNFNKANFWKFVTPLRDAYKALPRPLFGKSEHFSILLLPTFTQKLKQAPPTIREVHRWTDQSD
ncbi:hypothetical protein NFI96_009482 [Prochilodus magdalenae]|nr:hypothetical protein NFI96_009482 [Prochilodus magdalenae]